MIYPILASLYLGALSARAFEVPMQFPLGADTAHAPNRVAIVGAGAGGSSAAFWIGKAKERFGLDVEVDVYERESYIGGRSTVVYPHDDKALAPAELGASIFVKVNRNMWRASDEFNLTRLLFEDQEDQGTGFWDGQQIYLTVSGGGGWSGWWETAKVLWRYGVTSPMRARRLVSTMVDQIGQLYRRETPVWSSIEELSKSMGWTTMVAQSTAEYFEFAGVSKKYTYELIEAATRVNYGQDADKIHALEGACSMAADNAVGAKGGNFQIFERFLKASGANVYLDTTVHSITRERGALWAVKSSRGTTTYSAVILAAPYHQTDIAISSPVLNQHELALRVPPQPYVHLHVTLLTTTSPSANPEYFGLAPGTQVPTMMLTSAEGLRNGGPEPEFNSLSYHGVRGEGEWIVKIFSKKSISDEWLDSMFMGQVTWVHRKEWDAYPKLPPTASFPSVKIDRGLYYVNAFEPFISTMETETVASRNVVDVMLAEHFDSGICGGKAANASEPFRTGYSASDESYVYGWDC